VISIGEVLTFSRDGSRPRSHCSPVPDGRALPVPPNFCTPPPPTVRGASSEISLLAHCSFRCRKPGPERCFLNLPALKTSLAARPPVGPTPRRSFFVSLAYFTTSSLNPFPSVLLALHFLVDGSMPPLAAHKFPLPAFFIAVSLETFHPFPGCASVPSPILSRLPIRHSRPLPPPPRELSS